MHRRMPQCYNMEEKTATGLKLFESDDDEIFQLA